MNKIYLAVAVLLLLPVFSGGYLYFTESKCRELSNAVEITIQNAKTENAGRYFETAEKKWRKMEGMLAVSANHSLIEDINESFTKAKSWQELGEKNMLVAELEWLGKLIRHIYEMEHPTAYNIF